MDGCVVGDGTLGGAKAMNTHVRVLAILQIVYASLGLLLGLFVGVLFGGIATIVGFNAPLDDSVVAVPILAIIGGIAASFLIVLSLPRLIAGIALLKHRSWGRILTIVVSILGMIDFPFGTGLGIYALWVLLHKDTVPLFDGMPQPAHR
jgi:hypothetical protein